MIDFSSGAGLNEYFASLTSDRWEVVIRPYSRIDHLRIDAWEGKIRERTLMTLEALSMTFSTTLPLCPSLKTLEVELNAAVHRVIFQLFGAPTLRRLSMLGGCHIAKK